MNVEQIVDLIEKNITKYTPTLIEQVITEWGKKSYLILIACLLSLRAKDKTTINVCRNLFFRAQTPEDMLKISASELEKLIYTSGFYKNKTHVIREVTRAILNNFNGSVPESYAELISLPGIGPKTANLVLGMAFDVPAICVDTHVHRISNRLGIIKTKNPEQTIAALEKIVDKKYWIVFNKLLVIWGQNICLPRFPRCSKCALRYVCDTYSPK